MKKYLLLTILPVIASCSSTRTSTKLADFPARPTQDASERGVRGSNKGLAYPHRVVDQTATSSLDITEDSGDYIGGVSTRQVRDYGSTVFRSGRRGSEIVRKEGTRYTEEVYNAADQGAELARDETISYGEFVGNGVERTMYTGGTLVDGVMTTYSNAVDSTSRGIFGGLLRRAVRTPKNYMVGSVNDEYKVAGMPGAGMRIPQMPVTEVPSIQPSGKGSYTVSK